ncbi:MAG: hypothetical protein GX028_02350 [Clostridiaceae bacterium]|nr:hypothetical protein [Clostridiaceae bacterium]
MHPIEIEIVEAQQSEEKMEALIKKYEAFILSAAAQISRRHITKSDDEWSIAFYDAVRSFDQGRGSFISYAKLIIKSRLIDYFRSERHSHDQISIDLVPENEMKVEQRGMDIKYEIQALEEVVKSYGFSYLDLIEGSPKARKTKDDCKKSIRFMLSSQLLTADMKHSKLLPVKKIEENTKVPRKIIERHRKYIVTAVEILTGDYPHLSEYLAYVKEDDDK